MPLTAAAARDSRTNPLYAGEQAPADVARGLAHPGQELALRQPLSPPGRDQVRAGFCFADVFSDDAVAAENRYRQRPRRPPADRRSRRDPDAAGRRQTAAVCWLRCACFSVLTVVADRDGPRRGASARHQREQRRPRPGRHHRERRQRGWQPVERSVRLSRGAGHDRSHAADEPVAAHRRVRAVLRSPLALYRGPENRRRRFPRDVRQRVDRPGVLSRRAGANHVGGDVRDGDHRALDTVPQRAGHHRSSRFSSCR